MSEDFDLFGVRKAGRGEPRRAGPKRGSGARHAERSEASSAKPFSDEPIVQEIDVSLRSTWRHVPSSARLCGTSGAAAYRMPSIKRTVSFAR